MFNCEKHDKHKELFAIRIYIDDFVIFPATTVFIKCAREYFKRG